MKKTLFYLSCLVLLSGISTVSAQMIAPVSLDGVLDVRSTRYTYNPETRLLTKTYTLINISGETLKYPKVVNLFLWSNDIFSPDWSVMPFDAFRTYANDDQLATVANDDGFIRWSAEVTPGSISSTALFPDLPVQEVRPGVSYPYWNVPGFSTQWPSGHPAVVSLQFEDVSSCNWIQNMLWIVHGQGNIPVRSVQIDRCNVKAGKNGKGDSIQFTGLLDVSGADFNAAMGGNVVVTIKADGIPDPSATTFSFPIEEDSLKKGRYKSPKVKSAEKSDSVTSLQIDTVKGKFKFSAKNVDLTGLSCPVTVTVKIGSYEAATVVDEDIVNGPNKPCPPELVAGI